MTVTRLLCFSSVAALAIGCSSDVTSPPFRNFVYSAAAGGCGPADEPAVVIFLAPKPVLQLNPGPPVVWVFVPAAPTELTAHAWPIGPSTAAGAWFQLDASTPEIAGTGSMSVSSIGADKTVNGSLDLQFPNVGIIASEFHATWLSDSFYCI